MHSSSRSSSAASADGAGCRSGASRGCHQVAVAASPSRQTTLRPGRSVSTPLIRCVHSVRPCQPGDLAAEIGQVQLVGRAPQFCQRPAGGGHGNPGAEARAQKVGAHRSGPAPRAGFGGGGPRSRTRSHRSGGGPSPSPTRGRPLPGSGSPSRPALARQPSRASARVPSCQRARRPPPPPGLASRVPARRPLKSSSSCHSFRVTTRSASSSDQTCSRSPPR